MISEYDEGKRVLEQLALDINPVDGSLDAFPDFRRKEVR